MSATVCCAVCVGGRARSFCFYFLFVFGVDFSTGIDGGCVGCRA